MDALMDICGAAGRSALSKASGSVVKLSVHPERSSDQPGRSIQDSGNCKYRKRYQEAPRK